MDDISSDTILYVSENKKETKEWFEALNAQMPFSGEAKLGFIRKIVPQIRSFVKTENDDKIMNSDRSGTDNRTILANALESAAQNSTEKELLAKYKAQIAAKNAEEAKLKDLKAQMRDIFKTKYARDTEKHETERRQTMAFFRFFRQSRVTFRIH